MFDISTLLIFVATCAAIAIVPGPTVTVIIANSLRGGAKAGLLNIAGTQAGLVVMLGVVAFGLEVITTSLAFLFDWLRVLGAAYLIWLGVKLLRSDGTLSEAKGKRRGGSYFWQGFLVIWSNPKALLFFGAFIPQFVQPGASAVLQTIALGAIFMAIATVLDCVYALAAGRAGSMLTQKNIRATEVIGGSMMVGGGLWLGLSRNS